MLPVVSNGGINARRPARDLKVLLVLLLLLLLQLRSRSIARGDSPHQWSRFPLLLLRLRRQTQRGVYLGNGRQRLATAVGTASAEIAAAATTVAPRRVGIESRHPRVGRRIVVAVGTERDGGPHGGG